MQFLEKAQKMLENIEISNLEQPKQEKNICYQNKTTIKQFFFFSKIMNSKSEKSESENFNSI